MLAQFLQLQKAEAIGADTSLHVGLLDALDSVGDFLKFGTIFVASSVNEEARDG